MPRIELHEIRRELMKRGLAPRSVTNYYRALRALQAWCRHRGIDLHTISGDQILEYRSTLPVSWSSVRAVRSGLLHYWAVTGRREPPLWALRLPKKPRKVCRALDEHEAQHLACVAEAAVAPERPDAMAVMLALYLALRRFEIASLRWESFNDDGWVTIYGKLEQTHHLPVHPALVRALDVYRGGRPKIGFLFPGRGARVHANPMTVYMWVVEFCQQAGLGPINPHRLRDTALTTANDRTGDLRAVMEFARHVRPETTAAYTRTTKRQLMEVVRLLDYGAGPGNDPANVRRLPRSRGIG